MTREEIRDRILSILSSKERMSLQMDVSSITDETSLLTDLSLDSIQILELTVAIEEAFQLSLLSEELTLSLFNRLGDLVDHIEKKTSSTIQATYL